MFMFMTGVNAGAVACAHKYKPTDTLSIQYQVRLQHSNISANKRNCIAGGTTDLTAVQNKVCKLETADPNPSQNTSGGYTAWTYQ